MTVEIVLSTLLPTENFIRPILDRFRAESDIQVRVQLQDWETAWTDLVRTALYGDGPDVSEIGNTWTGDLIAMGSLRPFSAAELTEIGPREALVPGTLSPAGIDSSRGWAIPWVTGSRMVFYRPNLCEGAGLRPEAVMTPAAFEDLLRRLREAGVRWPWVAWPINPRQIIQHAATWVWAAGGNFLSADGRSTDFASPQALEGFRSYFSLLQYDGSPERSGITADAFFLAEPGAAMRVSGPWLYRAAMAPRPAPGEIFAAPLPGPAFFGGSNLLVWKHTRHPQEALRLIQFLMRPDAQAEHAQAVGLLPARIDVLGMPPYSNHPFWRVAAETLRGGRTFPAVRMWGLVEERLSAALFAVAEELRAKPDADIQDLLSHHLVPLRRKLDLLLKEQG